MAALTGLTTTRVVQATYLAVAGQPVDPSAPDCVRRVARLLEQEGLALASIAVDEDGAVHCINPFPETANPSEAAEAGQALADYLDDHWHCR